MDMDEGEGLFLSVFYDSLSASQYPANQGHEAESQGGDDVTVRKEMNALRDGVVGNHGLEQRGLVDPPLRHLVAGHLHPHAVERVFGNNLNLCHHKRFAAIDHHAV